MVSPLFERSAGRRWRGALSLFGGHASLRQSSDGSGCWSNGLFRVSSGMTNTRQLVEKDISVLEFMAFMVTLLGFLGNDMKHM